MKLALTLILNFCVFVALSAVAVADPMNRIAEDALDAHAEISGRSDEVVDEIIDKNQKHINKVSPELEEQSNSMMADLIAKALKVLQIPQGNVQGTVQFIPLNLLSSEFGIHLLNRDEEMRPTPMDSLLGGRLNIYRLQGDVTLPLNDSIPVNLPEVEGTNGVKTSLGQLQLGEKATKFRVQAQSCLDFSCQQPIEMPKGAKEFWDNDLGRGDVNIEIKISLLNSKDQPVPFVIALSRHDRSTQLYRIQYIRLNANGLLMNDNIQIAAQAPIAYNPAPSDLGKNRDKFWRPQIATFVLKLERQTAAKSDPKELADQKNFALKVIDGPTPKPAGRR